MPVGPKNSPRLLSRPSSLLNFSSSELEVARDMLAINSDKSLMPVSPKNDPRLLSRPSTHPNYSSSELEVAKDMLASSNDKSLMPVDPKNDPRLLPRPSPLPNYSSSELESTRDLLELDDVQDMTEDKRSSHEDTCEVKNDPCLRAFSKHFSRLPKL